MIAPSKSLPLMLKGAFTRAPRVRHTWLRDMRSVNWASKLCTLKIWKTCAHPRCVWNTCAPGTNCGSLSAVRRAHARVSMAWTVKWVTSSMAVYLRSQQHRESESLLGKHAMRRAHGLGV